MLCVSFYVRSYCPVIGWNERSSNRVLLLEAGPRDQTLGSSMLNWKIHMPAALMYNLCDDRYNWFLYSIGCLEQI